MNQKQNAISWANVAFLTLSPLAALVGGVWYTRLYGIEPYEIILFVVMFFATGLSITGGYHRHFSHASYKANGLVRQFYLIFGACALQNSALNWASDHRLHHKFVDTDQDPYNAGRGFWWSHMGWIFYQTPEDRSFTNVGDLLRDPWVRWQHRNHWKIALVVGLGLPTLIGAAFGRPLGGFLWGGLIRAVFVHHVTFFINSLAHMWGAQPFSRSDSSKDSWWLAFLTNGEGYHNFHHRFPSDYRNGIHWYQWDPTKWLIGGLHLLGMTYKLHRIPANLILKARMEVDAIDAEKHLQRIAPELGVSWRQRLDAARISVEHAMVQWSETKVKIRELKQNAWKDSEHTRQQWKRKLQEYETRLEEARDHWRLSLRGLYNISV